MKKLMPLFCIAIVVTSTAVVGIWLMCREQVCAAEESWPIMEHTTMVGEAGGVVVSEGGSRILEEIEEEAEVRRGAVVAVPPHPVSLPALFEKQFDGRGLQWGKVLAENFAYTRYFITYQSGALTISGIMNVPRGKGPFPLLILNHGYIDPAVYTNGRGLRREQDYLARRGYVVIHPDYRNHAQSDEDPDYELTLRLGYVEDVINAVYAARASGLPSLDASRVGMLGHSMGGGVTLNVLAVQPNLVKAAVLFAPVSSDYRDIFEKWMQRDESGRQRAVKVIDAYGTPEENPEFWRTISVRNYFDRITAPIMIHHGTVDESVPFDWSQTTHEALLTAGKDSQLFIYDGEPHEFIDAWTTVMQKTVEFFDNHLKIW